VFRPLAHSGRISAEALLDQIFFGREDGSGTRILMTRYLDRIGEGTPYRMIEMGTNETIKQAVMANLGVALISQHTVTEELRSRRLVCLDHEGLPITRTWYLLHREDLEMTPTLTRVFEHIAGLGGTYLPRL
jgi:LysR family transcriptional regulator, low CO2-responsive transcriptional regulator